MPLDRVLGALRRREPDSAACWIYDLDMIAARARRFQAAFAPLGVRAGYALKANALPAILAVVRAAGLAAEAGSLGELHTAGRAGFAAGERILNGNGRTPQEAEFAAREGVHSVNADHVDELALLEEHAGRAGTTVRVALRVNPGIATPGHAYVATGDDRAKFRECSMGVVAMRGLLVAAVTIEEPQTAPSKRLRKLFAGYQKPLHGPLAIAAIGIERIRAVCPHFDEWLRRLEAVLLP
jgi:D-serine deaminase-like pyridoxal phosphate-dependent protein